MINTVAHKNFAVWNSEQLDVDWSDRKLETGLGKRLSPEEWWGKIWDGNVGIICNQYNLCFAHETVDSFDGIADAMIIDGVVHVLTIFIGHEYTGVL